MTPKLFNEIRTLSDKLGFKISCTSQEEFVREFQDRINWFWISSSQKLSEDFIREFQNKVNWIVISRNQRLSEKFIKEFSHKLDVNIQLRKHHRKVNKEAEVASYATKHGLRYEKGVLYAYRNHDQYGHGTFNKTITYLPGKYYRDWHCDLEAVVQNSFGLGIWPKGNTPVKVKVKDWGVEVAGKDDGKARVWGFTVGHKYQKIE